MLLTHVFAAFRSSSTRARVKAFSASASARRIASSSAEDRFTPDPDDGSCCTGLSCSCLCRFALWSFANPACASSVPVSRSLFVVVAGHIMSGTVSGKILALHSVECQPSVILFSHVLLPGVLQSIALICVSAKCSFRVFAAGSSSGLSLSTLHDCVVSHLDAV